MSVVTRRLFLAFLLLLISFSIQAQIKILFDATKAEAAGSADWVIDADLHNLGYSTGPAVLGGGNESNPQQLPTPAQSTVTQSTAETYWQGGISSWGIDLVKKGYWVETLPYNGVISYGNTGNPQDLSNYKVFVVCEPNILFTAAEKTALMQFVQNGGGLFMVSDHDASDRNNDGADSPHIWNDFMSNNGVLANPFGITFDYANFSQTTTNIPNLPNDPLLHGIMGDVIQAMWSNGTSITMSPSNNSSVIGVVYKTGSAFGNSNVMVAYSTYGNGKVVGFGDSSPCDDGTGDPNDQLYDGWLGDASGNHRTLIMNATIWLASSSILAPTVITLAATSVTGTGATLNGTVNPNGQATTYHFEYGTTLSYGNSTAVTSAGSGTTNVSVNATLSGLTGGATYHFRLVAVNSGGTANGNDLTFIPGGASVSTTDVTAITQTSASSGGTVSSDGGSSIIARGVCWATTASPVVSGNHTNDGTGTGTFTSLITGLSANTLYHVRAYATNSSGTYYGDDLSFTASCGIYNTLPFAQTFDNTTIPPCWSQVDNQGNGEIWQFGILTGFTPAPALTGNYAFLNSDGYGSGNSQNADLISPTLDLSGYTGVQLSFSHYFRSYAASSGTLSYSINNGTTWTLIQTYTTTTTNPATFSQTIAALAGQSQVKIKWNYTGTWGHYWAIDNVSITGTPALPTVTTTAASAIAVTSATSGGNVTAIGGSSVTARGVCWATTASPTVSNNHTTDGSGVGSFTSSITGLTANTLYHVRAYATNTGGTSYGSDLQFTTNALSLSVTPSNQDILSVSGFTSFSVTSNSTWTASSDQSWCIVTLSGTGNGTISATCEANTTASPRVANITITVTGLAPVVVTVTQAGLPDKVLNLAVFLEGLFNGSNMNKAMNATGYQYPGTIADQVTVELHNSTTPYTLAGGPYTVDLNIDGTASVTIASSFGSNYYIVVKHRNSLETWSGTPVSFSGASISYDFSSSSGHAYGNNLKQVSGRYVIYAGDVNQDGIIDDADMMLVNGSSATFASGYIPADLNGDGLIDAEDMILLDNNASVFVVRILP